MVMHVNGSGNLSLLKKAAISSFIVGACLLVVKFIAYSLTGSAAILSDAIESIVNIVTAAFALYSIHVSSKPADECHPYGHGKIEFFSAAIEGGAIIVAAIWISFKAISELVAGPVLHQLDLGVMLVAAAAFANAILGLYLVRIGKKEKSLTLEADGRHVLTDVATSAGVVVGLIVVVYTQWLILDSLIAILVAVNIVHTGWGLLKIATGGMMDAANDKDEVIIKEILAKPPFRDVCGHHKLRHRLSGTLHFVDFHLIFPKHITVEQAHAVATATEAQVAAALGNASVMAHIEPCKRSDCPHCNRDK